MNYFIVIILGGLNTYLWLQVRSLKKDKFKPKIPPTEIKSKSYEIIPEINRNRVDINILQEDVNLLKDQMDKCFAYFGSIINHSKERPYERDAIKKFIEEHGTKENETPPNSI